MISAPFLHQKKLAMIDLMQPVKQIIYLPHFFLAMSQFGFVHHHVNFDS